MRTYYQTFKTGMLFMLFLCSCLCMLAHGVWTAEGFVYNVVNREPIASVNISIEQGKTGTATDINGHFSMQVTDEETVLILTHVSYETLKVVILKNDIFPVKIFLTPTIVSLREVAIFSVENPAHRIIDSVLAHVAENNPKNIPAYRCMVYEKLMMTVDTAFLIDHENAYDSALYKIRDYASDRDFFLMENIVEKSFIAPDRNYNNIIATKISGIKNPTFAAMMSQLQLVSMYDQIIVMENSEYLSPVSTGSKKRYFFLLEDTSYTERGDTLFLLSYCPKKGTTFNGLKGIMTVNSNGWALQDVTAEILTNDTIFIKVKHREIYRQLSDGQWFPQQIHSDYSIKFDTRGIVPIVFKGKAISYFDDVRRGKGAILSARSETGIKMATDAGKQDSAFWETHRPIALTERERNTYHFIDSLGEKHHFDSKFHVLMALMEQRIKLWKFDIDLNKILDYQEYQGVYLGFGASTNSDFSKVIKLSGYGGYGFKDKKWKYGGEVGIAISRQHDMWLQLKYNRDALPIGREVFYEEGYLLDLQYYIRRIFVRRVDYTRNFGVALSAAPLPYLQAEAGLHHADRTPSYTYCFNPTGQTDFSTTTLQIKLRYAFREGCIVTPDGRQNIFSMRHPYPVLWLNYSCGFKGLLNGDFRFSRIEAKVRQFINWKIAGRTRIILQGGMMFGDVPYSLLFVPASTGLPDYTFFSNDAFATMNRDEFVNDCYTALFLSHSFGHFFFKPIGKITKWIDFQPAILTSMAWGNLRHPEYHSEIAVQDMRHGYFESGIMFKKLFLQYLSVGFMYRYGTYGHARFSKNFTTVISLDLQ